MTHKIFRDCENGRKNSENVPSYDGNFMGHIRTDCCDGFPLSARNFNIVKMCNISIYQESYNEVLF